MTKLLVFYILFILVFVACDLSNNKNAIQKSEIEKAGWLIGQWTSISSDGNTIECWSRLNDSALSGITYFLKGNDTAFTETILLVQKGEQLYYIPTVSNQNQEKPVSFSSTIITDNELVFENKAHDFPQIISYKQINTDSAIAAISGPVNGKLKSIIFRMKKQ